MPWIDRLLVLSTMIGSADRDEIAARTRRSLGWIRTARAELVP